MSVHEGIAGSRDLLVVGGGPAGLATAIFASLRGLTVTLLERRRFPVDKPCGEGLMPRGVRLLSEMGVRVDNGRPFYGIRYLDGRSVAEARFPRGPGCGFRRTVLSGAMADRARELGVELVEGARVTAIENGPRRARAHCGDRSFEADWLVVADGLNGNLRSRAASGVRGGFRRMGSRLHYRARPWSSLVEVHWAEGGEAYVTPVGEDEVGVAFLWHGPAPGRSGDELLARFPELEARLRGCEPTSRLQGAGPLRRRQSRVAEGRVAIVGDASGYVDAITGDGVALAFECARALAASLAGGGGLEAYAGAHRQVSRRYRLMAEAVLTLSAHPLLRENVLAALAANPDLFERFLSIANDGAPWRSLGLANVLRLARSLSVAAVIE